MIGSLSKIRNASCDAFNLLYLYSIIYRQFILLLFYLQELQQFSSFFYDEFELCHLISTLSKDETGNGCQSLLDSLLNHQKFTKFNKHNRNAFYQLLINSYINLTYTHTLILVVLTYPSSNSYENSFFFFTFQSATSYLIVKCKARDKLATLKNTYQTMTKVFFYQRLDCQQFHEFIKLMLFAFFVMEKKTFLFMLLLSHLEIRPLSY